VNILVDNLEEISSFNYLSSNKQTLDNFIESGVSQYIPLVQDLAKGSYQGCRQIKLDIYRSLPINIQTDLERFFNQYSTSNFNTKFDYSYYVPGLTTYKAVKFLLSDDSIVTYDFDRANTNTSSVAVIFNQINSALSLHTDVIKNINTNSIQYHTLDDSIIFFEPKDRYSNLKQVLLVTTNDTIQAFDWFSSTSSVEFLANSDNINKVLNTTSKLIDIRNDVEAAAANATTTLNTTNTLVNSLNNLISTLTKIEWSGSALVCTLGNTYIGNIATTDFVTTAVSNHVTAADPHTQYLTKTGAQNIVIDGGHY
jgi:hypothetical protein